MKTFQKIALVSAIAAAPFAVQADLTPMDDSLMGNTTGQAGVTIEINIDTAGISVGEIEYMDEGSVLLQNTKLTNVTNLTQTIDVDTRGDVQIGMSGVSGLTLDIGDDGTGAFSAVALKSTAGNVTELVNNVHLVADLGASTVSIMNLQDRTAAELAALPGSAGEGSVAIQMNQSIEITDLDVGAFGYTRAQADTRADSVAMGGNGDGIIDAGLETGTSDALASGSAVQLQNVKFYGTGGEGSAATINQTVWAKGGTAAQGGGVYINIQSIEGTLDIGGIAMGGESIGSVKVSNLNLAGMTQRIYGHP